MKVVSKLSYYYLLTISLRASVNITHYINVFLFSVGGIELIPKDHIPYLMIKGKTLPTELIGESHSLPFVKLTFKIIMA